MVNVHPPNKTLLLYKLILNGLCLKFMFFLNLIHTERYALVKLPDGITTFLVHWLQYKSNVFYILVNDILNLFDNAKCLLVKLYNKLIHSFMYADDLLILSETDSSVRISNYAKNGS